MGQFATRVQEFLCERLRTRRPAFAWETEYRVAGTPVDVAGQGDRTCILELEWRRADPADNTAKLFRHLAAGELADETLVCQAFTAYYDLERGGVSAKRKNAEFVGRVAARSVDRCTYVPLEFAVDPPRRGGDPPEGWKLAATSVVDTVCEQLE